MIRNYLTVTLRNLQKQITFTIINLLGLSVGIACFTLLTLFISHELSFDKFHKNAAQIYRLYLWDAGFNGQPPIANTDYYGATPTPIGPMIKQNIPDVLDYVQLQLAWGENIVTTGKKTLRESLSFADPTLFSIFGFPLKYGNTATALRGINDIVVTESKANELFGTDDVVGKSVEIQIGTTFEPFKISAVAKDIPAASTIRFDVVGNFSFAEKNKDRFFIGSNWHPTVRQTYVLLKPGSRLATDKKRLADFLLIYSPNYIVDLKNFGYHWTGDDIPLTLRLQPLLSIHTDTRYNAWGFRDYGKIDAEVLWILFAIATGILVIACINFTTLAIGRSAGRCREVGVRKVIGAARRQLVFQFLSEAMLLSILSAIAGIMLALLLLPLFNRLSGTDIRFSPSNLPQLVLSLTGVVLAAGVLSGTYPAFVLSGFKPVDVLKNKIRIGGSNWFTKSLVTFQFVLSLVLIVSTLVIFQQTKYIMNKNTGFDKENVVVIDASQTDADKTFPLFKQALSGNASVAGVASAAAGMGVGHDFLGYSDKGLNVDLNIVDGDYISVLGMKLMAGHTFRAIVHKDTINPMIINETMMRSFGWSIDNAVGKRIRPFQGETAEVIGVVKDFNYHALNEEIKNQAFLTSTDKGYNQFYVRLRPGHPATVLALIQKIWNDIAPGIPIKYSFLDENINGYYKQEKTWTGILASAAGICIFLACLGLLGLAALAAVNRRKEIGVRKVLGASVPDLVKLLLSGFLKLIALAVIIASPIAWFLTNYWLRDYANRIHISWTIFFMAGVFTFVMAIIAIGLQTIKAAWANPVNSLRTE